ncbi:hypothetical protein Trydic_g9875 [Trypoxylus dichotomus]
MGAEQNNDLFHKAADVNNQNTYKKSSFLMKISSYFIAVRPWSMSASLMPTLLGSVIAYKYPSNADFNYLTLLVTIFTVLCVHGAGNLVNTYFDFKKGIDDRKSDDRILVDHILTIEELTTLGGWLYLFGSIGFALLIFLSPAKLEHLALVYFGGLSSSFLYTGGIGFKYIALGDLVVLTIFGPISVLFAFMTQTGRLEWATIYYAVPIALNAEAILHSNNTRDMDDDKRAGIDYFQMTPTISSEYEFFVFLTGSFRSYEKYFDNVLESVIGCFIIPIIGIQHVILSPVTEEDEGVKYANRCEVCKILAIELENRLEETGKSHDVIETGYEVDDVKPKKKKEYKKSELRLVESLEGVCEKILEYNIHKERTDSTRFAKGMSQTFQALHGLVDKGVKVELGIPYELWDKPSAEITNMKTQCETLLEQQEDDIGDWYFNHQGKIPLKDYLCAERVLKGNEAACLHEQLKGEKGERKPKKNKTEL